MKNILLLLLLYMSNFVYAQSVDELMFPEKHVVKTAKIAVKKSLDQLQDSLKLNNKEIRLRKFKLTSCDQLLQFASEKGLFADGAEFLKENSCKGIYSFVHRTNRNGSHYHINYYFDENGALTKTDILFLMVTH